jgi:hypothetical protein
MAILNDVGLGHPLFGAHNPLQIGFEAFVYSAEFSASSGAQIHIAVAKHAAIIGDDLYNSTLAASLVTIPNFFCL